MSAAGLVLLLAVASAGLAVPGEVRPAWKAELPAGIGIPAGTGASVGRRLFVPVLGVSAYDLDTGTLLWRSPLGRLAPRNLVVTNGRVIAAAEEVFALDAETGRERWRLPMAGLAALAAPVALGAHAALCEVALAGGELYLGTSDHRVLAVDAETGRLRWSVELGESWAHPAVVRGVAVEGATVYAAVEQWRDERGQRSSGWLFALDPATGRQRFATEIGGGDERRGASAAPVVAGEVVLVADALANAMYALDRVTGAERWRFEGERGLAGFAESPKVSGEVAYAASGDGSVYALEARTGRLLWRRRLPAAVQSVALCGGALFAHYHQVVWLDPADGRSQGSLMNGGRGIATSAFTVAGKWLAFAGPGGVYALSCGP